MRLQFHTVVPAAFTLVGLVSALSAPASAGEIDQASAMVGPLGVSMDDLVFSYDAGPTVFLLNAGCALLFAAACIALTRADSRKSSRRIPLRPRTDFAR
jgi:hypothetical protein